MPNWQPIWEDVSFDYVAAEDAIAECQSCARYLDERSLVLGPSIQSAREQWRGRFRDEFDDEIADLEREASAAAADLRSAAVHIQHDIDEARDEQRRREAMRQQWWAEKYQEDLLASMRAQLELLRPDPVQTSSDVNFR